VEKGARLDIPTSLEVLRAPKQAVAQSEQIKLDFK
jgi:hypothetical protein